MTPRFENIISTQLTRAVEQIVRSVAGSRLSGTPGEPQFQERPQSPFETVNVRNISPMSDRENTSPTTGGTERNHQIFKMPLPSYSGHNDESSAADFLTKVEKYALAFDLELNALLERVMPCALTDTAYTWWSFHGSFLDWKTFKTEFMSEFGPSIYKEQLRRELDLRTQGEHEGLTTYIAVIADYYRRIGEEVDESAKVNRVLRQMHPQYKPYMLMKEYPNLKTMMARATMVQEVLFVERGYHPPPNPDSCIEPSLAYRTKENTKKPETIATEEIQKEKRTVQFVDPPERDYSRERSRGWRSDGRELMYRIKRRQGWSRSPDRRDSSGGNRYISGREGHNNYADRGRSPSSERWQAHSSWARNDSRDRKRARDQQWDKRPEGNPDSERRERDAGSRSRALERANSDTNRDSYRDHSTDWPEKPSGRDRLVASRRASTAENRGISLESAPRGESVQLLEKTTKGLVQ
jgi:hypothetical protein